MARRKAKKKKKSWWKVLLCGITGVILVILPIHSFSHNTRSFSREVCVPDGGDIICNDNAPEKIALRKGGRYTSDALEMYGRITAQVGAGRGFL